VSDKRAALLCKVEVDGTSRFSRARNGQKIV
jgi:hypothetical protein